MLKVLQINDYPTSAGGGTELLLGRTLALLRDHAEDVHIFTSEDLPDSRRTPRRYIDNPVARAALAARLDALGPDVVHLHNFYHVLSPGILFELERYRRRRPLRVVMTAHDYHLVCPNSGGNWFRRAASRPIDPARVSSLGYVLSRGWDQRGTFYSLLKMAQHLWNYRWRRARRAIDLVICPSRFMQRLLQPLGLTTCHVPNPVACAASGAAQRPERLRLVFAGRLAAEKGVYELIHSLPADFTGELTLIGAGPDEARCRAATRARQLEGRVQFLGWLPHAQALAEIARAHVLVLPSRCLEGAPLTLIEALAAGTNVLASNLGGMREIVEAAQVGFLFDPGEPASLALQLARIQADQRAGVLNRFDVAAFLAARREPEYLQALLRAYHAEAA
jgi:glycosyltransferase involved in cell wall biosynthesis